MDKNKHNFKVLVVGSFVMDLIVETSKFPERGETVLGNSFSTAPGGKGANQAFQMAKLGLKVDMLGKVGQDMYGDQLLASANEAGVNTSYVTRSQISSAIGNVQIEMSENGQTENRIIVVSGANMDIQPQDLEEVCQNLRKYDLIVLQHEIPLEINKKICLLAKENGVKVLLNPAPFYPIEDELLSSITYLVPNEHELKGFIEHSTDETSIEAVTKDAQKLLEKGVENVIVTLGNKGSLWVSKQGSIHVIARENIVSVDPTAAGDSFIGGFVYGLSLGKNQQEILEFANLVGARTVSHFGAQTSLGNLEEIKEFEKSLT